MIKCLRNAWMARKWAESQVDLQLELSQLTGTASQSSLNRVFWSEILTQNASDLFSHIMKELLINTQLHQQQRSIKWK